MCKVAKSGYWNTSIIIILTAQAYVRIRSNGSASIGQVGFFAKKLSEVSIFHERHYEVRSAGLGIETESTQTQNVGMTEWVHERALHQKTTHFGIRCAICIWEVEAKCIHKICMICSADEGQQARKQLSRALHLFSLGITWSNTFMSIYSAHSEQWPSEKGHL